ncbi:Aminoglycoside acetyltransferase regulator [Serratia entomophila]|nr:Aminoglycoside acetyltransferase regulator [Serratia entomophila]
MLKMVLVTARDRARLKEISSVLIRYGLQDVIRLLGLGKLLGGAGNDGPQAVEQTLPERLRAALEALGPTFVKFGQILATRSDLLDKSWTDELDRLHSQAATLPWETLAPRSSPIWAMIQTPSSPNSTARRWPPLRWRRFIAPVYTAANRWW